jgi:hypothetical protein
MSYPVKMECIIPFIPISSYGPEMEPQNAISGWHDNFLGPNPSITPAGSYFTPRKPWGRAVSRRNVRRRAARYRKRRVDLRRRKHHWCQPIRPARRWARPRELWSGMEHPGSVCTMHRHLRCPSTTLRRTPPLQLLQCRRRRPRSSWAPLPPASTPMAAPMSAAPQLDAPLGRMGLVQLFSLLVVKLTHLCLNLRFFIWCYIYD